MILQRDIHLTFIVRILASIEQVNTPLLSLAWWFSILFHCDEIRNGFRDQYLSWIENCLCTHAWHKKFERKGRDDWRTGSNRENWNTHSSDLHSPHCNCLLLSKCRNSNGNQAQSLAQRSHSWYLSIFHNIVTVVWSWSYVIYLEWYFVEMVLQCKHPNVIEKGSN